MELLLLVNVDNSKMVKEKGKSVVSCFVNFIQFLFWFFVR